MKTFALLLPLPRSQGAMASVAIAAPPVARSVRRSMRGAVDWWSCDFVMLRSCAVALLVLRTEYKVLSTG
jgi:hypothetical protein